MWASPLLPMHANIWHKLAKFDSNMSCTNMCLSLLYEFMQFTVIRSTIICSKMKSILFRQQLQCQQQAWLSLGPCFSYFLCCCYYYFHLDQQFSPLYRYSMARFRLAENGSVITDRYGSVWEFKKTFWSWWLVVVNCNITATFRVTIKPKMVFL